MATAAERKALERARKRAAGLVLVQDWVPPAQVAALRRHAARLRETPAAACRKKPTKRRCMGNLFSTTESLAQIAAGELGAHGYGEVMHVRKVERIDDAFAERNGLSYGAYRGTLGVGVPDRPGLQGRYAVELCSMPAGESGVFRTVLMEEVAVAPGDALLVLHRRDKIPGFGKIHLLCRDDPAVRTALKTAGAPVYDRSA